MRWKQSKVMKEGSNAAEVGTVSSNECTVEKLETKWKAVFAVERDLRDNSETTVNEVIAQVADENDVSLRTLHRWRSAAARDASLNRKVGSGRPQVVSGRMDIAVQMASRVRSMKLKASQREMAGMMQDVCGRGSTTSVRRMLKDFGWLMRNQKSFPALTPAQKRSRLEFAQQHLHNPWGTRLHLHLDIDEKRFEYVRNGSRIYIPPDQLMDEPLDPSLRVTSSTAFVSVMFLGAVSRPRPEHRFDGKVLLLPCVERKIAKRSSKYRKRGEEFNEPVNLDRDRFIAYLQNELFEAVRKKAPWATSVTVQMDSAGGHGGKGQGMARTLKTLNDWGSRQRPRFDFIIQPTNSPDFNGLDVGAWNSLQTAVGQVRKKAQLTTPRSALDQVIDAVLAAWEHGWDAAEKLRMIFVTKTQMLRNAISNEGDISPPQHSNRSTKARVQRKTTPKTRSKRKSLPPREHRREPRVKEVKKPRLTAPPAAQPSPGLQPQNSSGPCPPAALKAGEPDSVLAALLRINKETECWPHFQRNQWNWHLASDIVGAIDSLRATLPVRHDVQLLPDVQLVSVAGTSSKPENERPQPYRLNRQQAVETWRQVSALALQGCHAAMFLHLNAHFLALYFHQQQRKVLVFDSLSNYATSAISWLEGTDAPASMQLESLSPSSPPWTFVQCQAGIQLDIDGMSPASCSAIVAIILLVLLQINPDDALTTAFNARGYIEWWRSLVGRFHAIMSAHASHGK